MHVIQITSPHNGDEATERLTADGVRPLGRCSFDGPAPHHLLVSDAGVAIQSLHRYGVAAAEINPPLPDTNSGILWWKSWREALPQPLYGDFASLYHERVKSRGSLVRIRIDRVSAPEPWRVLGDAGVDIRCEFDCSLPTGREVHVLVPDTDAAIEALQRVGVAASAMDYSGPRIDQGISWWGEWQPAFAYAERVQRPILLSFASPRVEHVPGVW